MAERRKKLKKWIKNKNKMLDSGHCWLLDCNVIVIYKTLCLDVAQGQMNVVPNETQTHSCNFASLAC